MPQVFPCHVYHPTDPNKSFLCPSQDFLDTIPFKDELEFHPFTGPRAASEKEKVCEKCSAQRRVFDKKLAEYKAMITEQKMEINRLKIYIETKKK